ncbi:MAG TPA: YggT family protein [Burkholderiales bacterium]|nr:YggT family protein [Burkholderiales bacterium]
MFSQIAHLLIQTAFGLLVYTLLLRFYMQALRAPFRNPVGQLVTALTNWIVLPARRVIPGLMGFDLATFLLAWLAQAFMLTLLLWVRGANLASAPGTATGVLFGLAAIGLLQASLYLLIGVVLIQVLFSWFNPQVPIAPVLDALTRPFYTIFRRFVPPIGNVDLSPLFVLVLAQIALILLDNLAPLLARLVQAPV